MAFLEAACGLVLLLVSADFLVRGAISLARKFGISTLMIGLTVVAFGTSAPEFVTSLAAALRDEPGLAVGNIVGSNLANSLLIVGVGALLCPFSCTTNAILKDAMVMLGATILFAAMALLGGIATWHGVILLVALVAYLAQTYHGERRRPTSDAQLVEEVEQIKGIPERVWMASSVLILALIGLVLGSRLLISGGVDIAKIFGVPSEVIGLTLIALGTSLPELATVVVAALRRHGDVAIGNVVGSNIFNLLAIGGGVAVVHPITVPPQILRFDLWVLLAVTGMMVIKLARGKDINRWQGGLLTAVYLLYIGGQYGPLRNFFDM